MVYGCITVECPRCRSRIDIVSSSIPEIFTCPICEEGEIHLDVEQLARQPIAVIPQKRQQLEQYVTTLSNIWMN